jgi:hypothetical protein
MSWKTAIYDYAHSKNRGEAEYSVEPLRQVVDDPLFLLSLQKRYERLRLADKGRRLTPLRNETRLRIADVLETPGQVLADISLHRILSYAVGNVRQTEERFERERLTLAPAKGRWRVTRIEPSVPERNASPAFPPSARTNAAPLQTYSRTQPVPYINYSILNPLETSPRKFTYHRGRAVQYAETWWNRANPQYIEMEVDCTNFVSQCLYAGGLPMDYTGKRGTGWWYRGKAGGQELWSYSWAVADSLLNYLTGSGRAQVVQEPYRLQLGDVICYDWDGDGRFQHNTIVTGLDPLGMPLVNAHTYNARGRYWSYHDSPAWSTRTRYVFLHIADRM